MKPISACITLAMLAVAASVYFRSAPSAQPPTAVTLATSSSDDARILAAKLVQLQRDLDALRAREGAPPDAPAVNKVQLPVEAPAASIVETPAEAVQAGRAADLERHREYMSDVAEMFANERIDNAWALQTSARINAAFDGHPALQQLGHDVECRARTCRVTVDGDSSGTISARLPALALSVADVLPSVSAVRVDQGNGRSAMVLYMSAQDPSVTTRPSK
jgi:hypothetical protein